MLRIHFYLLIFAVALFTKPSEALPIISIATPFPKAQLSEQAQKFLEDVFIFGDTQSKTLEQWRETRKAFWDGSIEESRQAEKIYIAHTERKVIGGVPVLVITPKTFLPEREEKVICYLHGGGFTIGSPEHLYQVFSQVAYETGCRVIAVEYRLAPEAPFPAGLTDCFLVYRELLQQYPPKNIAFLGDSAGGNLAIGVALKAKEESLPQPAALGLFSPLTSGKKGESYDKNRDPHIDYEHSILPSLKAYAGTEIDSPYVTVLHADFTGLAPILAQTGTRDALESDSTALIQLALQQRVDAFLYCMPEIWHGVVERVGMPEADEARHIMAQFLREKLQIK